MSDADAAERGRAAERPANGTPVQAHRRGSAARDVAAFASAHDVPRSVVEAAGMKSVTNLVIRHRFGDGPVVALNAHGDVVPPGLG